MKSSLRVLRVAGFLPEQAMIEFQELARTYGSVPLYLN
jgi:hypothetical protein